MFVRGNFFPQFIKGEWVTNDLSLLPGTLYNVIDLIGIFKVCKFEWAPLLAPSRSVATFFGDNSASSASEPHGGFFCSYSPDNFSLLLFVSLFYPLFTDSPPSFFNCCYQAFSFFNFLFSMFIIYVLLFLVNPHTSPIFSILIFFSFLSRTRVF